MKIDLEGLLYNFSSITINTGFFINSIKGANLKGFKNAFLNEFKLKNYSISPDGFDTLILRKDGIYFDENKIFSNFVHMYKTDIHDIETLKKILFKLENVKTYDELKKIFPVVAKRYKHMVQNEILKQTELLEKKERELNKLNSKKSGYKAKVEKINKRYKIHEDKIQKDLNSMLSSIRSVECKNISLLINCNKSLKKICEIPKQYYYIIDKNQIQLMVAEVVKSICLKEKKDSNMHNACIKYLNNYIDNNSKLIEDDYSFNLYYTTPLGTNKKNYSISSINAFIEKIQEEQKKKKNIERLNYSFLECKDYKTKDSLYSFISRFSLQDKDLQKQELLRDKINYYENLGYEKIYYGVDSFNGYVGICLDNGVVIMDKFFNKTGSIAIDEAVYITTEEDFSIVSRLSKNEVKEKKRLGELKVEKVNHSFGWQERTNVRIKTLKSDTSNC